MDTRPGRSAPTGKEPHMTTSAPSTGTTVQAWIDGGASTPQANVTLRRSEHNLAELAIDHVHGDFSLAGILLDADSLQHLIDTATALLTGEDVR